MSATQGFPKNWIFLRGLAREKRHWGDFPAVFQAAFPNARVELVDLPGIGENRDVQSPLSVSAIADFVREEAKELFPCDRCAVLALSLGGMVAMQWMQDYADDLEAVVLVNSSSRESAFYERLRYQIWPKFLKAILEPNPKDRERDLLRLLINSEAAREKAYPLWSKIAQEHPTSVQLLSRQFWAAAHFRGLNKKPTIPVLLLNSLGDRFVDPSCSEALHQKCDWQLERHPWAGHDLPWDDPQWMIERIRRFFP